VRGRHSVLLFRVAAVFFLCATAQAVGPGQNDDSGEAILTALAFPVITVAAASAAVVMGRRSGRPNSMLRAILGALVGLVLTAGLGLALMARDARELAFYATAIFTLGAIPTGLIGLIVGGLSSLIPVKSK